MEKANNYNTDKKMVSLRELRSERGLTGAEMAQRLGMRQDEYYRAENGNPPKWMIRAVQFFDAVFEVGYLPNQVKLSEKAADYRIDAND